MHQLDHLKSQEYCLNEHSIVSMTDIQGNITYANDKFCTISGYSRKELLGENHRIVKSNQHTKQFYQDIWSTLSSGKVWKGDICNCDKSGKPYWVASTIVPVTDQSGKIDHYTAIRTDITNAKLAESALISSASLLNETGNMAKVGGWDLDVASSEVTWTEQTFYIHELPVGDKPPLDKAINYYHPDDRAKVATSIQEAIEQAKPFDFKLRLITAKGNQRWVRSIGKPLVDNGKTIKVIGAFQDISTQKRIDEELLKMKRIESIGLLAGGIAHDFNNVLTAIFGNISILKEMLDKDHPAYTIAEKAEWAIGRATNLTNQLVTFSNGGAPVKEFANLSELIEQVIRFDLSGSNLKPVFDFAENLRPAKIDHGQIEQVFSNLCINAIQAMPSGGRIYISVENAIVEHSKSKNKMQHDHYLKVIFRDEGCGMSAEVLEQVFDPYFSTKEEGRGLGLATVHSIISKHNCKIEVESTVGKGTTFTLFLPASTDEETANPVSISNENIGNDILKRVLVMDDDASVLDITVSMLRAKGYQVEAARNGQEAVDIYHRTFSKGDQFDCTIMDLTVPGGMGGKEALDNILEIHPEAKVIVSSGYSADAANMSHYEMGFKGTVQKPFTMHTLCSTVKRVIELP